MMLKYGYEYCGRPLLHDRVCSGTTSLITAAYHGRLDACRLLVERKADLTARDRCPQITRALLMRVDLTPCVAAAALPCKPPSRTTWWNICAASGRRSELE
jgi:hypothetical protein